MTEKDHPVYNEDIIIPISKVPYTSQGNGVPTWTNDVGGVTARAEQTTVQTRDDHVTIISGGRSSWIASDTYTNLEAER